MSNEAPQRGRGSADASNEAPQRRPGSADASNEAPQRRRSSADASQHERNERLLRDGVEAFNQGDYATLVAMFDPGIECHVASGLGNPGTWFGIDGFERMTGAWGEAFASQQSSVVSLNFPDEHHVIAEIHQRAVGAGSGVPVEMTNYYLLEIRDERAVRFHIHPDRESALAAVR